MRKKEKRGNLKKKKISFELKYSLEIPFGIRSFCLLDFSLIFVLIC